MKRTFVAYLLLTLTASITMAQESNKYLKEQLPEYWSGNGIFSSGDETEGMWWRRFEDAVLDSLIEVATRRNLSVLTALENINTAKALWRQTQATLFPTLDLNSGWQRGMTSANNPQNAYTRSTEGYFSISADFSWEIDIFSRIQKRSKAQKQLFMASEEEYRAVMTSLYANVATTYYSLKQSIAQLKVLQQNAESQKNIKSLVESRYNSGLASKLDVAQARSVYYSTAASIPSMESTIESLRNALAILLATYPSQMSGWHTDGNLPQHVDAVAVGVPAMLLRNRPDVRSAEREVEAYALQLGAAKRDWLPSFYINGSIGSAAEEIDKIARARSITWQIAPSISWNLFDGKQSTYAKREAQAALDKSIISFNSTVLKAIQEVENAMSQYRNSIKQIVALSEAVNHSNETLKLSLDLYKQGLTQFQNVLDAQRTLLNYQNYLVQAQGGSIVALIQLYEALGCGW